MFRRIREDPGHIFVLPFVERAKLSKLNENTLRHISVRS